MKARPIDSYAAWAAALLPRRFVQSVPGKNPLRPLWFVFDLKTCEAWERPTGADAAAVAWKKNLELN